MKCDDIAKLIPLYYYGELTPDEEEQVEEHTHECVDCGAAMEQQRVLAAALDRRAAEPPAYLIEDCRADLMAAVHGGAARAAVRPASAKGPWTLFLEALQHSFGNFNRLRQPIGAAALIAIGFFGASLTNRPVPRPRVEPVPDDAYHTVRSVQSDPNQAGAVLITFDETRRRQTRGRVEDPIIQRLLVAAAHEDNPAVRFESVDLLKNQPRSGEVRDALINVLAQDPNDGVRLKAIEGLQPIAIDPDVRRVLVHVLRADSNTAVKIKAIDLLSTHRDDAVVGIMQALVQREQNDSVRLKLEKALREWNASLGTF
ncbi:MAG TPA: HEAT repeat domain-containing protein [Candidatus Solibacter sp.]|nr:HEAT repeat domain-containing protein [Candidatus Solibacter sp.]